MSETTNETANAVRIEKDLQGLVEITLEELNAGLIVPINRRYQRGYIKPQSDIVECDNYIQVNFSTIDFYRNDEGVWEIKTQIEYA